MSIAERIRKERDRVGLTLDQLADKAGISKTYLWELEHDTKGQKKPSADVLLHIAKALSITIADLLAEPSVQIDKSKISLSSSLLEFRDWMKEKFGTPLPNEDLQDLAAMKFRGGQPKTRDDWFDLYRTLKRATEK